MPPAILVETLFMQVQQVLRTTEDMKRQVYRNTALLQELLQRPASHPDDTPASDAYELPIRDVEGMNDLEQWLTSSRNYKSMVHFVHVHNSYTVFSNSLMLMISASMLTILCSILFTYLLCYFLSVHPFYIFIIVICFHFHLL